MDDDLSRLPPETIFVILRHMPDLPSLYCTVCASAYANAVFENKPAPILDEVIARSRPWVKPFARVLALLGSRNHHATSPNPASKPTFDSFVDMFKSLPDDVLNSGPPSSVFITGTPGPRYLLLTAYRIDQLWHIVFVTLLNNIHELVYPSRDEEEGPSHVPSGESEHLPGRSSMLVGSWRASLVERTRIERSLWNLMVYWNIRAIHPEIPVEEINYYRYDEIVRQIYPGLGFKYYDGGDSHEVNEMDCVSAGIQSFFNCEPFDFFMEYSSKERKARVKEARADSTIVKKIEEYKQGANKLQAFSQLQKRFDRPSSTYNSFLRWDYWNSWKIEAAYCELSMRAETSEIKFPDCFGLCLWDRT